MFSIDEPMPNTWVHHRLNLRPYKYLELRIIKDKFYKFTSFKRQALQGHKLQKLKPTSFKSLSPQTSKVQAHKIQRLQNSSSKPTKQWPTTTSLKAPKLKFKAHQAGPTTTSFKASKFKFKIHQAVAHNNKLQGFKAQVLAHWKVAHNIETSRIHKLNLQNNLPFSHKTIPFSILHKRPNKPKFLNTYSHLPKGPISPISQTITDSTKIVGLTSPIS